MYNTTTACIIYLGLLRGSNDLTATTSGSLAWNSDTSKHVVTPCLSMDSIFSLAFYVWTFYVFCPSLAVNKTVVHIVFKCIAWSSCLCLVHSRAVRKPLCRAKVKRIKRRKGNNWVKGIIRIVAPSRIWCLLPVPQDASVAEVFCGKTHYVP